MKILLIRGETWHYASTVRRNGDNVSGKRVRSGQKVDLIVRAKAYPWEILLCEVAPPSASSFHCKWFYDRSKLITGMKDSLDLILREYLNGATCEEMKK